MLAQEMLDSVGAVVRDAETGEPVPYVSIYVSPTCGTICNYDGEFSLQCLPSDVLNISCIGYQRISCKASELPSVIHMKPTTNTLREVTVVGADNIMSRLVRKMLKETKKYRKTEGNYFFRLSTRYPGTDELAEAFLTAKSCVQMRDITFHCGARGILSEGVLDGPDLKGLGSTNLHVFLRLAPVLVNYDVWDFAIVPADIVLSRRGKLYDVTHTMFTEDDGTEIRKINVKGRPDNNSYTILEGSLFVDNKKCQLLRFDGQMRRLFLRTYDNARRRAFIDTVQYTMHMDFRHDHGFTEIANMSGTVVKNNVTSRYILFNLGEKEMTFKKSVRVGDNMLRAIDEVGFDSLLWATTGIVKRTHDEERVAFQDSSFFMSDKSKYKARPSAQEAGANKYLRDAIRQLKGNVMPLHHGLP